MDVFIKDVWEVDKNYVPPLNSDIIRREINTRTGDERFLRKVVRKRYIGFNNTNRYEGFTDSVFLSQNPLMWFCTLVAYIIYVITPFSLFFGLITQPELFKTPFIIFIAFLTAFIMLIGEIRRKNRELIISLYTYIIALGFLLIGLAIPIMGLYYLATAN